VQENLTEQQYSQIKVYGAARAPEQHSKKCHNPDHSALLGTPCLLRMIKVININHDDDIGSMMSILLCDMI
jgi:hypothetical protein